MFDDRPDRGAEIVLVGRSNVGKSTLMRILTGHDVPIGQRPGVTRSPNSYDWTEQDFVITDLPGFGFMSGVPEDVREQIKTNVVQYLEAHADAIVTAVLVVDGKSVIDIIDRHTARGDIPHDVEMYDFLQHELDIPTIVAVNKIDKVDDVDSRLNDLCDRLGLIPPWQQWSDIITPISAKRGDIEPLLMAIRSNLHEQRRDDLLGHFTK